MRILIVYGTTEGQTSKIARFMENLLLKDRHEVVLANASKHPPEPDGFDAILIGSSIHLNKYNTSIKRYVQDHISALSKRTTAFFSVSMAIVSDIPKKQEEVKQIAQGFLENTGWDANGIWHIAGALKFTKYDYLMKMAMRSIARKEDGHIDINTDYEYTYCTKVKNLIVHLSNYIQNQP